MTTNIDSIRAAAEEDLANLTDPVGLQRTIIQAVVDEPSLETARQAARKCRDAVELRHLVDLIDAAE
jgi:hypothetical protein